MTNAEKTILLKDTIYQLYSKEGRSLQYISELLGIDRKIMTGKIREWGMEQANVRHMKPSNRKFLNKHKAYIKKRLDEDNTVEDIARDLGVSRYYLSRTIIYQDEILKKAEEDRLNRQRQPKERIRFLPISEIEGEIWKPILGFENYEVSNLGRIRAYSDVHSLFYEVHSFPNKNNGRLYVLLFRNGYRKNMQVARLVAHAFCEGYAEHMTVNHIDGNVQNNTAENLEWVTQKENNQKGYDTGLIPRKSYKRFKFSKIVYQGKYEFSTVRAFAKFLGKSETQTRRYMDRPEEHDIEFK